MKISTNLIYRLFFLVVIFCAFSVSALSAVYEKVTTTPTDWSGKYLIVCESEKVAFNGSLTKLDVTNNGVSVTILNGTIEGAYLDNICFEINADGSIKSTSGYYIGRTANSNGLNSNTSTKYTNTFSLKADGSVDIKSSGGPYLRFNSNSDQRRFRYYGSGQKAICLYKLVEEQTCTPPDFDFVDTEVTKTNGSVNFTNILTTNSEGEITYRSSDLSVATVATNGEVTIVGVGTTTITASIAATSTHCEASASYELIVTSPRQFTITWKDGDKVLETTSCTEGSQIIFPENPLPDKACQYEGWEFAGWSLDNIIGEIENPTILDNTYIPTSDVTLYAVYKKETEKLVNDAVVWVQKPIEEIKYNDVVIITMTTNSGKGNTYAISNNNGTGAAPTAVKVTKNGTRLDVSSTDNILWNVTNNEGTLTIYPNGTTKTWLYCTNTNNGVRVGTNADKTFVIDATYGYLQHIETKRYLGVYEANPDWRCYPEINTNIANQDLDFYVKSYGERVALVDVYSSNISCEPIEEYMITFGDSEPIKTQNKKIIDIPILPESCNASYSTKVGWTAEASFGISSAELVLVDEKTQFTQNTQLYPVYSKGANGDGVTWTLIKDASTLVVGDQVVIAAKDYNYALSTNQKSNNRGQASITKNGDNITFGNDVQILTVQKGIIDGTLAFYTGSGYLYAASNSSNHLKTQVANNANGSWKITVTDGTASIVAQGNYTRNTLQYNLNNGDPLFSCYAEDKLQQPIAIYRKTSEYFICSDLIVEPNATFDVEDDLNISRLTIKSNLDQAGQLNTTNASITAGNITIEKTIDASRYFFFSLPFDCNITDIEAFDVTAPTTPLEYYDDYTIFYYDQKKASDNKGAMGSKAWVEITDTNTTLKANQGYIIGYLVDEGEAKATIKFKSAQTQTISTPDTTQLQIPNYTWYTDGSQPTANGWNLIGMPYYTKPANATLDGGDMYLYSTIPNQDGKTYSQVTFSEANISPFTSFFVQVASNEAPSFAIATQQSAAPMLRNKGAIRRAVVALSDANGGVDNTTIIDNPNTTADYEIGHDLVKWLGYAAIPQIYTIGGDDIFAFNSFSIDDFTTIPLGVYAHADGDYTFALGEKSFGDLQNWQLYDNETNATTLIASAPLTVYLEEGTHEGRFELRMKQRVPTTCTNPTDDYSIYSANGTLSISNLPLDAKVYIYDAVGRLLYADNVSSTMFTYNFSARGVYNIVVISAKDTFSFKTLY